MTNLGWLTAALADRYRIERELGSGGMAMTGGLAVRRTGGQLGTSP